MLYRILLNAALQVLPKVLPKVRVRFPGTAQELD